MKTALAKRVAGASLMVGGSVITAVGGGAGVAARYVGEVSPAAAVLAVVLAVVLVWGGIRVHRWGKRIFRSAGPRRLDPRPPVLYLRPFQSDDRGRRPVRHIPTLLPTHLHTDIEQLALPFEPLGPLELVHPPASVLPDLPGRGVSLDDAAWRLEVDARIQRARLVLLRAGTSEGLLWEMETCLRRLTPDRLILVVPGSLAREEYEQFVERFRDRFPRPLPAYEGGWREPAWVGALIWFMPDWEPRLQPVQEPFFDGGIPLARAVEAALRPYRQQYRVPVHAQPAPPPRRILAGVVDAAVLGAFYTTMPAAYSAVAELLFLLGCALYFVAFEVSPLRGTPGKRLLGLRIVSPGGLPISVLQSVVRSVLKVFSAAMLIPGGLSLIAVLAGRRTLHDVVVDTIVERRPGRAPVPAERAAPAAEPALP